MWDFPKGTRHYKKWHNRFEKESNKNARTEKIKDSIDRFNSRLNKAEERLVNYKIC